MGSGQSVPDLVNAEAAQALAGDRWDAGKFDEQKDADGFVTKSQLLAAAGTVGRVPASELAKKYDLIVIGGGPAGVAAALKAAQLGRRALIVDKPKTPPGTSDVAARAPAFARTMP
jgi:NADPH-dependent 2,4-dienoyl-CoA reductase/sulfur reductase-like enzyme